MIVVCPEQKKTHIIYIYMYIYIYIYYIPSEHVVAIGNAVRPQVPQLQHLNLAAASIADVPIPAMLCSEIGWRKQPVSL